MVLLLIILLFIIGLIFVLIKLKHTGAFILSMSVVLYILGYMLILSSIALCYAFKNEKQELEWCREQINNNVCDGWDILIIDKYSRLEPRPGFKGTSYLIRVYYVTYRYQMINGPDKKNYTKKRTVCKEFYDYYQIGKHYHNNCVFLTKDSINN